MKIEMLPTNSVKPYDRNPRDNDAAVDAVARSIKEFGFRQPIVVDTDGVIVVGHTRHRAAMLLELAEVPVHVATDLSPAKLKAYRIADNKTGELATWDKDMLAEEIVDLRELAELPDAEVDLDALGFEDGEIAELLGEDGEPDLDATPAQDDRTATPGGDAVGSRASAGHITHDDSRDWLQTLEPESFAACVTDPPYDLGFMGRAWDKTGIAMDPEFWRGVFRVLKPGAHLVAFGGTRTFHRITCAIEDAGFVIRDVLSWNYGQGFPKGIDVSRAIDAAAGIDRKVVGESNTVAIKSPTNTRAMNSRKVHQEYGKFTPVTAPATEDAEIWEGWNTALRPGWEPIILARKPLSEKTVAANVLKHGTGAINVGACRIASSSPVQSAAGGFSFGTQRHDGYVPGTGREYKAQGRWPANVILQHAPECVRVGTREVARNSGTAKMTPSAYDGPVDILEGTEAHRQFNYGNETIDLYACIPGCPIRMIDEQSGYSKSPPVGSVASVKAHDGFDGDAFAIRGRASPNGHGDSGGASRFFYCSKSSTRERSAGLPDGERSLHPTVKPIAVMRWLVRLLAPPDGKVLEPFAGSGTTCCACELEGFDYAACEQEEEYVKTAQLRAAHWRGIAEELRADEKEPQ